MFPNQKPPQFVVVRRSNAPGDFDLKRPEELLAEAGDGAQTPSDPNELIPDFGSPLPPSADSPPKQPQMRTKTWIAIGGLLIAGVLIVGSVLAQVMQQPFTPAAQSTGAAATVIVRAPPTTPTADATAAPGIAATITTAAVVYWAPAGDPQNQPVNAGTNVRVVGWYSDNRQWRAISGPGITQPAWVIVAHLSTMDTSGLPDLAPPATPVPFPPPHPDPQIGGQQVPEPTVCATVKALDVSVTRCGHNLDALQKAAGDEVIKKLHAVVVPVVTMTPSR